MDLGYIQRDMSNQEAAQRVVQSMFIKPEYQAMIEALYHKLQTKAHDLLSKGVEMNNVLLLTDLAMKQVGKLRNLVGFEKKALVLTVVRRLAEDTLEKAKQSLINAGEALEEVTNKINAEFEELRVILDKALDPFVDQLYILAPKVYGQVKAKCCPCLRQ